MTDTHVERKITDHSRTVNKVCWHPQKVHNLLSASQDGTMRLWVRYFTQCSAVSAR